MIVIDPSCSTTRSTICTNCVVPRDSLVCIGQCLALSVSSCIRRHSHRLRISGSLERNYTLSLAATRAESRSTADDIDEIASVYQVLRPTRFFPDVVGSPAKPRKKDRKSTRLNSRHLCISYAG